MATTATQNLTQPLMSQIVREQPEVNMEGNVTNSSIVKNLLDAMRDLNFNDLVTNFASVSGTEPINNKETKSTEGLMAEIKTPPTPKEVEESQEAQPQQEFIAPEAPTPTSDAMKMNQVYKPPAAIEENTDTGLMTAV